MRYTNRGLRFLDQAVTLAPNDFAVRVIRANVANNLPELFGRQATAIEDGLVLDKMFSAAQSPAMAPAMIRIYEILGDIAPEQGDWEKQSRRSRAISSKGSKALWGKFHSKRSVAAIPPAPTKQKVLDKVDLKISDGNFSVVCGPSGSGKSTLLNIIGTLDAPDDGSVMIEGGGCARPQRK